MFKEKTKNVPLPSDVVVEEPRPTLERPPRITHKQIFKTIDVETSRRFDWLVNEAIRKGWHLDRRFVNVKTGNFVAFMSRYVTIEELEEYNEG